MIRLRNVRPEDLEQILAIEKEGFVPEEAATRDVFIERINMIPDTFIVAEKEGRMVGYINGPVIQQQYISDDLFKQLTTNPEKGGVQSVLGVVTSKRVRNEGIARMLIQKLTEIAEEHERKGITLTCRSELVPFYEKLGFQHHGRSDSQHAGVLWYNMYKKIKPHS